tara:strand:+ start:1434 stop:1919 length:486 start_codon:yes stop_codon:yes gene_type:complete
MNLKHISKWINQEEMEKTLLDKNIKSWLLEKGPITNRIKSKHNFELKLLRDSVGKVKKSDKSFLDSIDGEIRIREVVLFADENPKVFARSLIPESTIKNGLKKLGELNTKPLGDILFERDIFQKDEIVFSIFSDDKNKYWGRKIKYYVKSYPLSVMEVFLI